MYLWSQITQKFNYPRISEIFTFLYDYTEIGNTDWYPAEFNFMLLMKKQKFFDYLRPNMIWYYIFKSRIDRRLEDYF